jgi:carboxypeptidase PM20D1
VPVKKLILVLVLGVVVLGLVLLVNGLRLTAGSVSVEPAPTLLFDSDAAVRRFADAIQIPTISFETVEETDSARFLELHAHFEAAYPTVHETLTREVVGGLSLLYTWEGSEPDLDPVVLMGHQDVVPVIPGTESDWTHEPFGGVVADGYVWGRGTMDDKVSVVAILEAVELLLSEGYQPRRTIYLAFGHDEEVGGPRGAGAIAALLSERGAEPYAFVLDEGGTLADGLVPGVEELVALVGIAEKGYVNVELKVEGPGGHSSMPPPETNIGVLAGAIDRLQEEPFPASFDGATRDMFTALAPHMPVVGRMVFANLWLLEPVVKWALARDPTSAAMLRTTTAPTIIQGGVKSNVLPIEARAVVNHRIMPGETPETVRQRVENVIDDPRVQVTIYGEEAQPPSPVSDPGGEAFQLIGRTIRETTPDREVVVAPWLVVGGTDAKYYSGSSANVFRFLPARFEEDVMTRFHGTDERMSVDSYLASIRFFHRLIRNADGL